MSGEKMNGFQKNVKRAVVLVNILFLWALSSCSISYRIQSALTSLRATPTPAYASLGISGDKIIQFYEDQGFHIDKNQGVPGENQILLKSPDGSIPVNFNFFHGEVTNGTIWLPISPQNTQVSIYRQQLMDFLNNMMPDWTGRSAWLEKTIQDATTTLTSGSGDYYTIFESQNAIVELSASIGSQQLVLLVYAKGQPSG